MRALRAVPLCLVLALSSMPAVADLVVGAGATLETTSGSQIEIDGGTWDDSAGTFQAAGGKVVLKGASVTVKTGSSNRFFDLDSTGTLVQTDASSSAMRIEVAGAFSVGAASEFRISSGHTLVLSRASATWPPQTHVVAGTLNLRGGDGTNTTRVQLGNRQQLVIDGAIQVSDPGGGLTFGSNRYVHFLRSGAAGTGYSVWVRDGATAFLEFVKFDHLYGRSSNSNEITEATVESALAFTCDKSGVQRLRVLWFDNLVDGGAPPNNRYPRYLYFMSDDGDVWNGMGGLTQGHKMRFEDSGAVGAYNIEKRSAGAIIQMGNNAGARGTENWDLDGLLNDNVTADPDSRNTGVADIVFGENPTAVRLADLTATPYDRAVVVDWRTAQEVDNLGFNVYRSRFPDKDWVQVNQGIILGLGDSSTGGRYYFLDRTVANGIRYYYQLEDIDVRGERTLHGPVSAIPLAELGPPILDDSQYVNHGSTDEDAGTVGDGDGSGEGEDGPGDGDGRSLEEKLLGLDLAAAGIRLLSYDETGALLEVLPPEASVTAEEREGRLEYAISMRAYSATRILGRPEVPTKRILLVTPDILEARSTLIETESRTLPRLPVSRTRAPGIVPASSPSAPAALAASREPSVEDLLRDLEKDVNARIRIARRELMEARRRARLRLLGIEEEDPGRREPGGSPGADPGTPGGGGGPAEPPPGPPPVDRNDVFPGEVIGLDPLLDYGGRQLLPIDINPVQVFGGAEVDVYRRILVRIDFLGRRTRDPSASREEQFRLAADGSALKLVVDADGIYRLGRDELEAAGLDVSADPRTFRLFHLGREVAIRVEGEIDGVFGPEDEILFLGTRNPWRTSDNAEAARYTERNVYWLTAGSGFGKRMREAWVQPVAGAIPAADRWTSIHVESNAMFFPRLSGGDDVDRWFGADRLFNTPGGSHPLRRVTVPIALADLSNVPHDARVEVLLGGLTDFAPGEDHRVVVAVNGQDVGEARWAGFAGHGAAFQFPSALLVPGANEVELRVPADLPGIPYDSVLVNFVRLAYRARFAAAADRLVFAGDVPGQYEAAGFASPDVVGLEASDPLEPRFLRGLAVDAGAVRFNDVSSGGGGVYRLAGRGALRAVDAILANAPSTWNDAGTRADWVAIAPSELLEGVHPLADHRRARGHETGIADLADVYDEFSGGIPDPAAIRDFLAHARAAWDLPPRFALLVGDGSFDPQGYTGAEPDLLPARLVEMEYLASASDNWFAAVEGEDILPDLAIGRFAVRDPDGLAIAVAKTIAHEDGSPAAWHGRATLVADGDDNAYDFSFATALFADRFPADVDVEVLDLGQLGTNATRSGIRTAFDEGRLLVGYMGHGSTAQWANENVLDVAGVASLAPTGRTGLVTAMGCMNGMFHLPGTTSLGEAFLDAPEAGAAAFWGSSSLVDPLGQEIVYRELLSLLFDAPRALTIGEAINEAKVRAWTNAGDQDDVVKSWILLGDPALRLRLPE